MNDKNVWALLYDEEAVDRACVILTASVGADVNHKVLLDEIRALHDWINEDKDPEEIARRFVGVAAALAKLAHIGLAKFAHVYLDAAWQEGALKEDPYADVDAVSEREMKVLRDLAEELHELARSVPDLKPNGGPATS